MDKNLNFKKTNVNEESFYIKAVKILTGLEDKYAKALSIMLKNYPETVIDDLIKDQFIKLLDLEGKKKSYQMQTISNCLTYLTENNYLKKIQNGVYILNSELIKLRQNIGENKKISFTFNFEITNG